jgi:hypothetical protein
MDIFTVYSEKRRRKEYILYSNQKERVEKDIFHTEIFNFLPQIHVEQERKPSAHKYKNFNQICIRKEYKKNMEKIQ